MPEMPPGSEFWFGTDAQGRDIYSRVLYGARVSLTVGIVSQLINTFIGVCLGMSAAYWGGWWDDLVSGLTNLMLAISSLIFALAIVGDPDAGPDQPPHRARPDQLVLHLPPLARRDLSIKEQGYVEAARSLGYTDTRIMFRQVLPNIAGPIIVIGTLGIGAAPCWPKPRSPSSVSASARPSRAGARCSPTRATRSPPRPGSRSSRASRSS